MWSRTAIVYLCPLVDVDLQTPRRLRVKKETRGEGGDGEVQGQRCGGGGDGGGAPSGQRRRTACRAWTCRGMGGEF